MRISIDEAKKRLTAAQFRRRKRIRARNSRSKSYYLTSDGRRVKITAKRRRAQRMQARRLRRIARMSSVKRKIARTKRLRRSLYRQVESTTAHSVEFITSLLEVVRHTGDPSIAADLLEATDPADSSTLIGYYMQDVTDQIDKDQNLARAMVDSIVLDDETFGVLFEKDSSLTASSLLTKLGAYGKPLLITQPGDKLSDSTVSEMFFVAVTAPPEALEAIAKSDFVDDNYGVGNDPVPADVDESEAISALCRDTVFREPLCD